MKRALLNMSVFFLTVFFTSEAGFPPLAVTIIFLLVLDAITLWLIQRWSGNGYAWNARHRLALIAGFLGFFVFFCFAKDFETWRGISITGLAAILEIWTLWRSETQREKLNQSNKFGDK
jgi:hypothetical protein